MDIYSIFMVVAIILSFLLPYSRKQKENYSLNKKIYGLILGTLLFLIAALRSTSVGIDSLNYSWIYNSVQLLDFKDIISLYEKELGFYLLIKILSYISSDHQIMFILISGIFAYSISRFIYKYSKDQMVSFIMLITMIYFAFSLTGLRQTIAMSIIIIAIDYIVKRQFLYFFALVFIASLFHQSALLFIPAYFLKPKKISFIRILLYIGIALIIFLLRPVFLNLIQVFLYSGYNIDYEQTVGGWTSLFVYILILITAVVFKTQLEKMDTNFSLFFSMMYMGMLIQMFVPLQPNIFRVSMYYNIASIILIPGILRTQNDRLSKLIVYSIFFILMSIQYYLFTFYAAGANPYKFFWQGGNQ